MLWRCSAPRTPSPPDGTNGRRGVGGTVYMTLCVYHTAAVEALSRPIGRLRVVAAVVRGKALDGLIVDLGREVDQNKPQMNERDDAVCSAVADAC